MNRSNSASSSLPSPPHSPTGEVANPYVPGATFVAYRHEPPAPFGVWYSTLPAPQQNELQALSQLDWCISHPPAPGITSSSEMRCLSIVSEIRTGDDCGAQLVRLSNGLVAKIYDPLFYPDRNELCVDLKVNVATNADSEYSIEAAAYSELKFNPVQGTIMPTYHDSWTIKATHNIGGECITRDVRLILIEYIPGIRMLDLDTDGIPSDMKADIMVKVIEADYDLRYAGVRQDDLSPRNIIITFSPEESTRISRLTLIDFGHSTVYRILFGGLPLEELRNPLFDWVSARTWSSYGWLPSADAERVSMLWDVFGDGRNGKYIKVERDTHDPWGEPLQADPEARG